MNARIAKTVRVSTPRERTTDTPGSTRQTGGVLAVTAAEVALYLGIYATLVSTAVALLTLYGEVFQRVRVIAREAYRVPKPDGRALVVVGDDALDEMEVPRETAQPILTIGLMNRGRQPVQIQTVSKAYPVKREVLHDVIEQLPVTVAPGHVVSLTHGAQGGFQHGDVTPGRFFALDGTGRIHPLHERWRQALENLLYRDAVVWYRNRARRRQRAR